MSYITDTASFFSTFVLNKPPPTSGRPSVTQEQKKSLFVAGLGNANSTIFYSAINTQLLKVIVEDYINHLSSAYFKVFLEIGFAEKQNWYRTNRISAEFDLLYRWHPFAPISIILEGEDIPAGELVLNNGHLEK